MNIVKDIKRNISIVIAETRRLFYTCDCRFPYTKVVYSHISKNDTWCYSIECSCGNKFYTSK